MNDTEAAEAVRRYLQFLENPEAMRDEAAIAAARDKVAAATDPLDKLDALAALERLQRIDGETFRLGFARHAKAYAEERAIPVSAFEAMGVPRADLAAAGLVAGGRSAAAPAPRRGSRARRVSVDEVITVARGLGDAFSIAALAQAAATTTQTATKAVRSMEDQGIAVAVGEDREHSGPGRAPMLYRIK
jgi:hypothetical protein